MVIWQNRSFSIMNQLTINIVTLGGVCFMNQFFRSLNSLVSSYKCFSKESCFLFNAFVSEASFDIEYIKEFRFYLKCNVTEKFEIMCIYQWGCVCERKSWFCVFKRFSGYIADNVLENERKWGDDLGKNCPGDTW